MAEEAAPVEVPVVEAPAAPEPHIQDKEPFAKTLERLGGLDPSPEEKATGKTKAAAKAEAKAEAKDGSKPKVVDIDAELTQLKELAKKHGYEVDTSTISNKERAAFRQYKANQKAALEQQRLELESQLNEQVGRFKGEVEVAHKLLKANADGDYQQIATLLGYKDWDDLQNQIYKKLEDPNYLKIKEMEEKLAAKERAEQEARQRWQQQQEKAGRDKAVMDYITTLKDEMRNSPDPVLNMLHDDDLLVRAIFHVQKHHYQENGGTLSAEKAIRVTIPGQTKPLIEQVREQWDRLHKAFGAVEPTPGAPAAPTKALPKGKTTTVPTSKAKPQPTGKAKFKDDAEYSKYFHQRLAEAALEESLANGKG